MPCVYTFSGQRSPPDAAMKYRPANSEGEGSISPQSPLSPHFSPPPIRNAALKSMFPQVSSLQYMHIMYILYCGSLFHHFTHTHTFMYIIDMCICDMYMYVYVVCTVHCI